jgi:hypothetical protein
MGGSGAPDGLAREDSKRYSGFSYVAPQDSARPGGAFAPNDTLARRLCVKQTALVYYGDIIVPKPRSPLFPAGHRFSSNIPIFNHFLSDDVLIRIVAEAPL